MFRKVLKKTKLHASVMFELIKSILIMRFCSDGVANDLLVCYCGMLTWRFDKNLGITLIASYKHHVFWKCYGTDLKTYLIEYHSNYFFFLLH